ncbi:TonB-dependent receptor [Sphingomonas sp. PAMC 26621]|uniref:TonB-dependent receptor n=1 Tax=Sphingomonas sp. PAMC 26621 TaxID=1112213 RepID=UPI0002881E9A|nr:TonB-dependent receptor [Sphingomonas sp. PAMC 26621]
MHLIQHTDSAHALRQRRKRLLIGATSLVALSLGTPAFAQVSAQNAQTDQPAPVQPAVPATSPTLSASEAGTPQDEATAPDAAKSNTAATPGDTAGEDIIVTGLRGSLQRNLDIKRNATGVVDAISAEDIGKFPDSNVAASLQRLPGVSIQRAGTRGEATGITVRGFGGDFNTTLYDGRRISTGTGGRQIDFSTVGSDFIGQLSVLKTPDVSLTASSIGATVNIEFPKPFDHPGFRFAASGSGSIQDRSDSVVPTAGLLLSDTFANDTLGVLADFIYTRRDTDSNRVSVQGWPGGYYAPCQLQGSTSTNCAPTSDATSAAYADPRNRQNVAGFFPQQYLINKESTKDERYDGRIALQWHPSDDLMVTIDDNFSRQTVVTDVNNVGFWFNQGALRNVVLDQNGQVTNFTQTGTPTDFGAQINTQVLQTNQIGGNVKWDVGEHFTVDGDLSYSKSWLNPERDTIGSQSGDIGYGNALGVTTGLQILGNSDKAFPVLTTYGPNGSAANYANTGLIGSHVAVNQTQNNTDELKQARLTATWKQDDVTLKVGGQYIEDRFKLSNQSTFTNNYWQAYAGYGAASGSKTGINPLPASLYQGTISLANFIPGYKGTLPPSLLMYSPIAFQNFLTGLGNPQTQTIPGFNAGANIPSFTGNFDQAVDPGSVQDVKEATWSLYFSAAFKTEIAGMPLNFAAGVRNENTHLTSTGQGRLPLVLTTSAADPTLLSIPNYSSLQGVTTKSNYSYLLPSLDVRLGVTDRLQVRFDASRTLTRPSLNLLTPVLNVGNGQRVGALTASGGNPNLKPYLADNFDVAAEWYYKRNSYLSVDFFLKNVSNFIVGGVTRQPINGVVDPTTGQLASFAVTQQVNGPDATVRGVELAWQQVFGDTGFGFNANATFVNTNKPYDATNLSQTGFAVTGLANSANFVGFYDKHGFQFRAAVNWRDKYLLQFGQAQNTGQFGSEPTFVNSSLQLDLTSSYDITKQVSVFGEVQNVNNNQQSTSGRFANQLLDVYDYGRRYVFGVHYRF